MVRVVGVVSKIGGIYIYINMGVYSSRYRGIYAYLYNIYIIY